MRPLALLGALVVLAMTAGPAAAESAAPPRAAVGGAAHVGRRLSAPPAAARALLAEASLPLQYDVYVADYNGNAVKKLAAGASTPVSLGSGFSHPTSVFVAANGDVYVADSGNGAVKRLPGGTGTSVSVGSGWLSP